MSDAIRKPLKDLYDKMQEAVLNAAWKDKGVPLSEVENWADALESALAAESPRDVEKFTRQDLDNLELLYREDFGSEEHGQFVTLMHENWHKLIDQARRAAESPVCTVPPSGWRCTRKPGHDGPCAAVPSPDPERQARERLDDDAIRKKGAWTICASENSPLVSAYLLGWRACEDQAEAR